MKTKLILAPLLLIITCSPTFADDCNCKIVPFKPDPPCFQACVSKILASASYGELTGKYGLPDDISRKIINAREKGADTSSGWYKNVLSSYDISHIDAKFKGSGKHDESSGKYDKSKDDKSKYQ